MSITTQDLSQSLLLLLECPSCNKYMVPPIKQCGDGHNLCSECINRLVNCPKCGQTFIRARNFPLEEIARKLEFPCEFRGKGCTAMFKIDNLETHQQNCPHNALRCKIESCKVWSSRLSILVSHVKEAHADSYLVGASKEMKITKWVSNGNHWYVYLLQALGQHFWLHYRLMGGLNRLMVAVQSFDTTNYRYEVAMGSADTTMITYSAPILPEDKDMNGVFMSEDCFSISTRTAKNFIKSEKTLVFKVSVKNA